MQCNQQCVYCNSHWPTDNPKHVGDVAIAARMAEIQNAGVDELIITGGEPTLRSDLTQIVAQAKAADIHSVVLETNGTAMTSERAEALARAGLSRVRVNLAGWGPPLDAVTGDPGGFDRTLAGLHAFICADVPVVLSVTLTASTAPLLPTLFAGLRQNPTLVKAIERIWLSVPVASPSSREVLSHQDAVRVTEETEQAARKLGIGVQLNPEAPLRPCMFSSPGRVAHLFSMTAGERIRHGYFKPPACEECLVADRCAGLPEGWNKPDIVNALSPIKREGHRRRLSAMSSLEAQMDKEFLTREQRRGTDGKVAEEHIIRVSFHCNQACRFCFVSTHLPRQEDTRIEHAIDQAVTADARITFSGGEPTLHPRLVDFVARARRGSAAPIELQTNATRLAQPGLAKELAEAGLDEVFISLHASTAELSDRITEAPGTFIQTVAGIDAIVPLVPKVTLHYVICNRNANHMAEWIRWVSHRWPTVRVNFSFVGLISDVVPRDADLLPRYSDVLPQLEDALVQAEELNLAIGQFHSMCGIPLCMAPEVTQSYLSLADIDQSLGLDEFIQPEPCQSCELQTKCFGIRKGYARLHGTAELVPQQGS